MQKVYGERLDAIFNELVATPLNLNYTSYLPVSGPFVNSNLSPEETGSIGHCGHTGQSIFVDLKSGLYAIILSDMTISTDKKFGSENYDL